MHVITEQIEFVAGCVLLALAFLCWFFFFFAGFFCLSHKQYNLKIDPTNYERRRNQIEKEIKALATGGGMPVNMYTSYRVSSTAHVI